MNFTAVTRRLSTPVSQYFSRHVSKMLTCMLGLLLLGGALQSSVATAETVPATHPTVLYTDILYGPNSGGENNRGAYLSIFGRNFGNDLTKVKVFINNKEVAAYKHLGPSKGRPDVQQLSVQVGAVSSGPIRVEVNGVPSNISHTFTVQPGKIYYVALNGNDSTGVAGDITKPFRLIQNGDNSGGVWRKAAPGDFIVMRGGEWRDVGLESRFLRMKANTGTAPNGSAGTGPISIMGYPGENVLIHSATSGGIHNRGNAGEAEWIVIAGLRIRGGDITVTDAPINMQWGSDNWRIVNNELFDWAAQSQDINGQRTEARAGGIAGNGNKVRIFGNGIHGIGGGTKNHGIYIDFDGSPATVEDIEIAWNHIYNHTGGNIIQLFGSLGPINNVNIHHNLLHDGSRYALNFGNGTGRDVRAWNNVVYNIAYAAFRLDANNPQNMRIANNVFYNVANTCGSSCDAAMRNDWNLDTATLEFKNNVVIPSTSSSGYTAGSWGTAVFQNNVWYGKGNAPSKDSKAFAGDPQFVNPSLADFRLKAGSPAIDNGVAVTGVDSDYFGAARSIDGNNNGGSVPDIGAIETLKPSGPAQPAPPSAKPL